MPERTFRRSLGHAACIFAVGSLLTLMLAWWLDAVNARRLQQSVTQLNSDVERAVEARLNQYQFGLRGMRGALLATGGKDFPPELLERYSGSRDIEQEFPGARGFGFIRRVPRAQEAQYVAAVSARIKAPFAVRALAAHDGERYVIEYIAPFGPNRAARGLDIASEVQRRTAADLAARSGRPVLTGPITLVQQSQKPLQSFLFLLPVYDTPSTPATPQARLASHVGWSYAPLLMEQVLGQSALVLPGVTLELDDVTERTKPVRFYRTRLAASPLPAVGKATTERVIFGRTWRFTTSVDSGWSGAENSWPTGLVLGLGGLAALSAAVLAYLFRHGSERARQLSDARAELAAIVESSADAIVARTLDGKITSWNRSAEQLFGYPAAQAVGQRLSDLIVPRECAAEEEETALAMRAGISMDHFETVRLRRDGSKFPASVSAAPVHDADGAVVGVALMVRDISRQKAAEAKIINLNENLEAQVIERTNALQQAQRTLRTIIDSVPSLIGYWDCSLTNLVANRAHQQWFGQAAQHLPGRQLPAVLGDEWYATDRKYVDAVLTGAPQTFERSVNFSDGRRRHVLTYLVPDEVDGKVQGFFSIVHDVTEMSEQRRQLTLALHQNEVLLQTINAQTMFATLDANGAIVTVNDNFCTVLGYDGAELIGRPSRVLLESSDVPEVMEAAWRRLRSGLAWRGDLCAVGGNGARLWCDAMIAPLRAGDGKNSGYVLMAVDITDRRSAEAEVARLNGVLNGVLAAATEVAIIATDLDGTITVFNAGAERMLGYAATDMVGRCTPAVFHVAQEVEARAQALSMEYGKRIEGFAAFVHVPRLEGSERRDWTYVTRDGRMLSVSLTVTSMHDRQGKLVGFLGMALDVSQQLQQQREMEASKEQLELAADVARLGIWSWTVADNVLRWNPRMYELYDQPLSLSGPELGYAHWQSRIHPDDLDRINRSVSDALAGTAEFALEFRVVLPDGAQRVIQAAASVERDAAGQPLRLTGMNLDITERRVFEDTLLRAKLQAEQASAAKGLFLANMSHEIRTPLNATLGMLELLRRTQLNDRQADYAFKAQSSAQSLLALLNDILDFSKIEAGKLQIDLHPFDLELLLRDLGVVLAASMGAKQVEVLFDVAAGVPRELVGDRLRLQQVLINLAGNALKFTNAGQVVVRISLLGTSADQVMLRLSVIDSGIGISAEQVRHIFEGFTQAEASTTRRYGGTGLGLAISKRLIKLMGSELRLESALGQGSHFWFDLQLQVHQSQVQDAGYWNRRLGHLPRVLVVDDHAAGREILGAATQALGWATDLAGDGPAALQRMASAALAGQGYDLVLMDWRMPGMDGLEAAEQIPQVLAGAKAPAVIMVTAVGRETLLDGMEQASAPFKGILSKPVTPLQIVEAYAAVLERRPLKRDTAQDDERPLQGLRILVVEDNPLNRQVAFELLASTGAQVQLAEGGLEGIRMATSATQPPDVVLMDVQMPDMDGLEATRRIRGHAAGATLPVIAMTANASQADRDACLEAGMQDHIGKPIAIGQVARTILSVLGRDAAGIPAEDALAGGDDAIQAWPVILRRFNGEVEIYAGALQAFIPQCRRLLSSVDMGAPGSVAKQLHNLKGMAATLGAAALARRAGKLERMAAWQPQAFELTEKERAELWQLAQEADGCLRTACELARRTLVPAMAEPAAASPAQWKAQLTHLRVLLVGANTAALDAVAALRSQAPASYAGWSDELEGLVNEFRFEEAAALVARFLEEQEKPEETLSR